MYHVLEVNFLNRITVLYYKPLVVLWYTLKKKKKTLLQNFCFLFLPIVYLSYR